METLDGIWVPHTHTGFPVFCPSAVAPPPPPSLVAVIELCQTSHVRDPITPLLYPPITHLLCPPPHHHLHAGVMLLVSLVLMSTFSNITQHFIVCRTVFIIVYYCVYYSV